MKPVARIGKPDVPRQRRTILDRFWWIDWSCWWIAALHDLLLTFAGTDRSNDPWVPCIANLFHPIYYSIGNFVLEISSSKQYDNNERFEAFSARYLRISRIERFINVAAKIKHFQKLHGWIFSLKHFDCHVGHWTEALQLLTIVKIERKLTVRAFWI